MSATATATITYRKTKKTGEWVAFGPASIVRPGVVTVIKRSGETKQEIVSRTGRSFTTGGVEMVYGYLAPKAPRGSSSYDRCRNCRCHTEHGAGLPGSIMFDGCDRCGCDSDC